MSDDLENPGLIIPDYDSYPIVHSLDSATAVAGGVLLRWNDGEENRIPALWLREFSPDAGTFHTVTREQRIALTDIPSDVAACQISIEPDGFLQILWAPENLLSRYHPGWLRAHLSGSFHQESRVPDTVLWPAGGAIEPSWHDGAAIYAGDDTTLLNWLEALARDGVGLLKDLPLKREVIPEVPELIGPLRNSNFGDTFEVENLPDGNSNAFTAIALKAHSDLATRVYVPGLQFLFSLHNDATGGESILVDGFAVAEQLRSECPEFYQVLASQNVSFGTKDRSFDHRYCAPILEHNTQGQLSTVRHTYWLRSPMQADFDTLNTFYAAYRRFQEIANNPDNQLCLRLQPGQMMAFDNRRMLHGRAAFDPGSGKRLLRGCYGEREELESRLRILYRQQRSDRQMTTRSRSV